MSTQKSREAVRNKSSGSEQTVVLLGVAAMLLVTVLYIALGFAPDLYRDGLHF